MQTQTKLLALILLLSGVSLGGCQTSSTNASEPQEAPLDAVEQAIAMIAPTEGSQTQGVATFTQNGDAVNISVQVEGLNPNTEHAWHIHEFGDISDPNGKATGGHYNPEGHEHALPDEPERHAGDLGNLTADAEGRASLELTVENVSIVGELNPILGRGIIIHEKADDGGQPTGNAGGRIAQGVIGVANVTSP